MTDLTDFNEELVVTSSNHEVAIILRGERLKPTVSDKTVSPGKLVFDTGSQSSCISVGPNLLNSPHMCDTAACLHRGLIPNVTLLTLTKVPLLNNGV